MITNHTTKSILAMMMLMTMTMLKKVTCVWKDQLPGRWSARTLSEGQVRARSQVGPAARHDTGAREDRRAREYRGSHSILAGWVAAASWRGWGWSQSWI